SRGSRRGRRGDLAGDRVGRRKSPVGRRIEVKRLVPILLVASLAASGAAHAQPAPAAPAAPAAAVSGADFLAKNAKAAGVVTLPSGLQYKVVASGPAGPS